MEIYTMTRPSMPLNPACALLPVPAALVAAPVLAAERAPASRVHQVQVQAELAQVLTLDGYASTNGTNGSTGFVGIDGSLKRNADGGSGTPPRGRPV